MSRPASLIAAAGILTALICLPLSAALHRAGPWPWNWSGWREARSVEFGGPTVSRDFPWSGADHLKLEVPAQVHYHPAPAWHLSVRGPQYALDHLSVDEGVMRLEPHYFGGSLPNALQIDLSGPALRRVDVSGSGRLRLEALQQDRLQVALRGSGSVTATGRVDDLDLQIFGSGNAQLASLAVRSARIRIAGSGHADLAASDAADIAIAGSGDVRLYGHPRQMSTHISGSGRISEEPPAAAGS